MTKFDKANELLNKLDFEDGKYEITDALVEMYDWTMQYAAHKVLELLNETLINCEHENGDVYVTDSVATSKEDFLRKFKKTMEECL